MADAQDLLSRFPSSQFPVDVNRLRAGHEVLMQASRSRNTVAAYNHGWKIFTKWCAAADREPLPATPETVELFVVWSIREKHYRLETVKVNNCAIRARHKDAGHESPVDRRVVALITNAARLLREAPGGKLALPVDHVKLICAKLIERGGSRDMRDHAMLLLGFACGWRRSEIVSLRLRDVRFAAKGLRLRLGASKTDQDARRGRQVGIPFCDDPLTCPVRALRQWVEVRGSWEGPLFTRVLGRFVQHIGLVGDAVNERLKTILRWLGKDPTHYGAHSLRSGMVTAATEHGADLPSIMQRTGHRNVETVMRYVRPAQAFKADPLKGVL